MTRGMTVVVAVAALLMLGFAQSAAAAPKWDVGIQHLPTNLVPGEVGEFQIHPTNRGDATSSGEMTIAIGELPSGLTVTGLEGIPHPIAFSLDPFGPVQPWTCDVASLTCKSSAAVPPGSRGGSVRLSVAVDSGAAHGPVSLSVDVAGGGGEVAQGHEMAEITTAAPGFGIQAGSLVADALDSSGAQERQAGRHPHDAVLAFDFNTVRVGDFYEPVESSVRDIKVKIPRGLIGNPQAVPRCTSNQLGSSGSPPGAGATQCPVASQVGVVDVLLINFGPQMVTLRLPIFNMVPPRGKLADFGFSIVGRPVHIYASLDPSDNSIVMTAPSVNETFMVLGQEVTLWGVPADPSHDGSRSDPNASFFSPTAGFGIASPGARKPFLTLPSECGVPGVALVGVASWARPGVFDEAAGEPQYAHGCDRQRFEARLSVARDSGLSDAPSGVGVDVEMPQDDQPSGLGTPPLRDAVVSLPEGMSINPSAGDGLAACDDAQLGLGTSDPVSCPAGSRVGSVQARTPALEETIEGAVYVRPQASDDPGSGEMFRIAIVLENAERGLRVKLPGSVVVDRQTGRVTARFRDNPQLPVSKISVRIDGGERASLATPPSCGEKTTVATFSSWAGQTVDTSASFGIDCPGAATGFAPGFRAGTLSSAGGSFSPLVVRIDRPDREQYLAGVEVELAKGLLANLRGVELCPAAVAGEGSPGECPAGSRIGTATVAAGAGSPLYLQGPAYLTSGYNGAPYGLSVQVRAKAGPFDLGLVKVASALRVDPVTARVSVKSDPLPQIVKGVPVRLRTVNVEADRRRFTINPTSCAVKQIGASLASAQGVVHRAGSRFQAAACRDLTFAPKLAMALSGRKQTRTGGHPALKATLTQARGQANVAKAKVTLPRSMALDAVNAYDPKLVCDYDRALKADCPVSSVIGRAVADTPVLNKPLAGSVHLVQGIKFGKNGNRIRTLPTLLVKLRGEVAIDLRAKTSVSKTGRLETTFAEVPDAPVSKFAMTITGGRKGILVVTRTRRSRIDLCAASQVASVQTDGQNGRDADFSTKVKTPCAKRAAIKRRKARR